MPVRRRKRTDVRREEILLAAGRLFRERGYLRTSVEDIAAAVGITGAAIYRHFSGKQEILASLVSRTLERWILELRTIVAASASPETLDRYVAFSTRKMVDDSDLLAIVSRELTYLGEEDRADFRHKQSTIDRLLTDVICAVRPDLRREDAGVLALGLVGMFATLATHKPKMSQKRFLSLVRGLHVAMIRAGG